MSIAFLLYFSVVKSKQNAYKNNTKTKSQHQQKKGKLSYRVQSQLIINVMCNIKSHIPFQPTTHPSYILSNCLSLQVSLKRILLKATNNSSQVIKNFLKFKMAVGLCSSFDNVYVLWPRLFACIHLQVDGGERGEKVQKLSVARGIIHKSCDKCLTGGTKYCSV